MTNQIITEEKSIEEPRITYPRKAEARIIVHRFCADGFPNGETKRLKGPESVYETESDRTTRTYPFHCFKRQNGSDEILREAAMRTIRQKLYGAVKGALPNYQAHTAFVNGLIVDVGECEQFGEVEASPADNIFQQQNGRQGHTYYEVLSFVGPFKVTLAHPNAKTETLQEILDKALFQRIGPMARVNQEYGVIERISLSHSC